MSKKPLILALRGHVRDSFTNGRLHNFVKFLSVKYELTVYLHTWDIVQSNLSWRQMEQNNTKVTEPLLLECFGDVAIKNVTICDEQSIVLTGRTEGKIGTGFTPIRGWKNMWYGKHQLAQAIFDNENHGIPVLNMRYDLFTIKPQCALFGYYNEKSVDLFIEQNYVQSFTKNIFLLNLETEGIDNIYLGTPITMLNLAVHFHKNLDKILEKYPTVFSQEFLVFRENSQNSQNF